MQLERITRDSLLFDGVKQIYESSFPPEEKRELNQLLFDKKNYSLLAAVEDQVVGFISVWDLGDFVFIEHCAVRKELRVQGVETQVLAEFLNSHKFVILEVEIPKTEEQYIRTKFYEKIGFKLNLYSYLQPSYGPGKPVVHLHLMSYPEALSERDFEAIRKKIHKTVYDLRESLM